MFVGNSPMPFDNMEFLQDLGSHMVGSFSPSSYQFLPKWLSGSSFFAVHLEVKTDTLLF